LSRADKRACYIQLLRWLTDRFGVRSGRYVAEQPIAQEVSIPIDAMVSGRGKPE